MSVEPWGELDFGSTESAKNPRNTQETPRNNQETTKKHKKPRTTRTAVQRGWGSVTATFGVNASRVIPPDHPQCQTTRLPNLSQLVNTHHLAEFWDLHFLTFSTFQISLTILLRQGWKFHQACSICFFFPFCFCVSSFFNVFLFNCLSFSFLSFFLFRVFLSFPSLFFFFSLFFLKRREERLTGPR